MRNVIIGALASVLSLGVVAPVMATPGYFEDQIEIGDWSEPYVNTLAEMGILVGYPDGTFRPKENITREEFAVALVKALAQLEGNILATVQENDAVLYNELVTQQAQIIEVLSEVDEVKAQEVLTQNDFIGFSIGATAVDDSDDVIVNLEGKKTILTFGDGFSVSVNPFVSTAGEGGAALLVNKELGEKISVGAGAGAAIGWQDNAAITTEAGDVEGYGQVQVEYDLSNDALVYVNGKVPFTGDNSGDVTIVGGAAYKF
jgi:hypothetical protein